MTERTYCCGCQHTVDAVQVRGDRVYPHRRDLHNLVFWECPTCHNYVGAHKATGMPLGTIPTPELRAARQHAHEVIDPLWRTEQLITRTRLYRYMAVAMNRPEFHVGELNSVEEVNRALTIVATYAKHLREQTHRHP